MHVKKNVLKLLIIFFIEMNCVLNNMTVVGCLLHSNKDCHVVTITSRLVTFWY